MVIKRNAMKLIIIVSLSLLLINCYLLGPTYTVEYNGNGNTSGDPPKDDDFYSDGNLATILGNTQNMQKAGYVFCGWEDEYMPFEKYRPGDAVTVNKDMVLLACWTDKPFLFNKNTGAIEKYLLLDENSTIPTQIDGVTVSVIGEQAFSWSKMKYVQLPNTILSIEAYAFHVNNITSIVIPNSVQFIGTNSFGNNQIEELVIPGNVQQIQSGAFASNKIKNLQIENGISDISSGLFYNNNLTTISLPSSIQNIGKWAFSNNPITEINIYSNVTIIENVHSGINPEYTMGINGNGFYELYNGNGKKAGQYTYISGIWILK